MNVTFLITGLGRGGAETQLVRVASELAARGRTVDVLTMTKPESNALVDTLKRAQIPVTNLDISGGSDVWKAAKLVRRLRRNMPDTLCSFLFHANVLAVAAGRTARVPKVVVSIRSEFFGDDGDKRLKVGKVAFKGADAVTINSEMVRDKMVMRGIIPKSKMTVVPNAIDVAQFAVPKNRRDRVRAELELDSAFTFVAVGRVNVLKDYPTMIRALGKTDAQLLVCGKTDGKEKELLALAERSGAGDRVRFLGLRQDVPDILSASDALVLSSTTEGLPNSVLEGHAAGLPVVATDVGGVREIVTDVSGIVCPPSDPDALAASMQTLIALSPSERAEMGTRGKQHVEQKFGLNAVVDRWERVLFG